MEIQRLATAILDVVIPPRCPCCGVIGPAPCPMCVAALGPAPALPARAPLASLAAVVHYSGPAPRLVTATKYARRRDGWSTVGDWLSAIVPGGVDLVCWVPATPARRRQRGFDQAELLARRVARNLVLPVHGVLRRVDHHPQASLDRQGRLAGPRLVPTRRRTVRAGVAGRSVLLVDDVVATGSSMVAAALVLRELGATEVHGRAFAAAGRVPGAVMRPLAPVMSAPTLYHRGHARSGERNG